MDELHETERRGYKKLALSLPAENRKMHTFKQVTTAVVMYLYQNLKYQFTI